MRASIYNVFLGESLLLEIATLACLLALRTIAWQIRKIGKQLRRIVSMQLPCRIIYVLSTDTYIA